MNIRKILVSLLALACLRMPLSFAYAETVESFINDDFSLEYVIADDPQTSLNIIRGTASCTSKTNSDIAVSITVTHTLQKYGSSEWYDVDGAEWSKTVEDSTIRLSNSISGLAKGKYRVKAVFELTDKNGKSETITVYSNERNIG